MDRLENGKAFIWMQLLGFEREDADCGAQRFLAQTGFLPDGVCALLFHPDFVHQHRGMETEYELPADVCAYQGTPRNAERERQRWTNHNLRTLSQGLNAAGTGLYAGIMGAAIGNVYHREWVNDYPEVQRHNLDGVATGHFLLKRFKDGSYYEDFFIAQLCRTLKDYEMRGVHLADGLCPNGNIWPGDFSADMVTQFTAHTGLTLPKQLLEGPGNDETSLENERARWIWKHMRAEWIEFMCWRWEAFFAKLCGAVHAIGCEVMILGMYCTDPFETKYCLGMDLARVMAAGVDYLTANILPTSCYLSNPWESGEYFFHRYMAIAPTTAAHVRQGHLISMVGVQDATEEWDVMKHAPCLHERDLYTMMAYRLAAPKGMRRALEGYFLCLGDGLQRAEWDWERERMEIAFSAKVEEMVSPAMLWSEAAYENMLAAYITTRRWTPFKLFYELAKAGTQCGGCLRAEDLGNYSGPLLVPDFDLLSKAEQQAVLAYDQGPVVCTVAPGFDLAGRGILPGVQFCDGFSEYPMTAFALGGGVTLETLEGIEKLLACDDGQPNIVGNPADVPEFEYTLVDTLPFAKVTRGFRDAVALLLRALSSAVLTCDRPHLAYRLKNGAYRLYLFNDSNTHYRRAFVQMKLGVWKTEIVSSFPILPVRYISEESGELIFHYTDEPVNKQSFEVKLQPGGVTIVDVYPGEKGMEGL